MSTNAMSMTWDFPLPRTHTGVLLGNGVQGLLVWGVETLNLTVGRAGFWDHRGGNDFATRTTYRRVKALLEANDEQGLRETFAVPQSQPDQPVRPQQVGGGRLEITLPDGAVPLWAELDLRTATLRVHGGPAVDPQAVIKDGHGAYPPHRDPARITGTLTIRQAMHAEQAWIDVPEHWQGRLGLHWRPTWEWVGHELERVGVAPPERWSLATAAFTGDGFCQHLPEDEPLAICSADHGSRVVIASALGGHALERAAQAVQHADVDAVAGQADHWWADYWRAVPQVCLPDPVVQELLEYGLYKQAGLTTPGGIAATLQGPWLEEYQLPPWSCDYHFNINIEMIYWPTLASNRLEHLQPLWDLIDTWLPQLQANAKGFFEVDDALMLPHAVDDQCRAVGAFWTGTIDHACTAWMAQLAWLHYRYSMDEQVLRQRAWPMLVGAFNGFWAMIEEDTCSSGCAGLCLPVSVSPEYRGARMDAWGKNASFQLAACHFLAQTLPVAADILGEPVDPRWQRVRDELPPYALVEASLTPEHPEATSAQRIGHWEQLPFIESHRHHSHLACIYPFTTVTPDDPAHHQVVRDSVINWVRKGTGGWSGWCVPWASVLHGRMNNADGAVAMLHVFHEHFTNEGRGTLHDGQVFALTTLGGGAWSDGSAMAREEIMQMDGGMGCLHAVLDLLVHYRRDHIAVLPSLPSRWRQLAFDGVLTEGAFIIGATVAEFAVQEIRVHSRVGGVLRLAPNMSDVVLVNGIEHPGTILEVPTEPGQDLVVRPA